MSVVGRLVYNDTMHILSVGASVIDLFLDIDPDHVKTEGRKVSFELGDKVPSEIKKTALGGNGSNVSVGLSRLEIPTTFYTFLGNDFFSREIYEGLSREGVELNVERHDDKFSPLHIILDFPTDRVILANYSKSEHNFQPKNKDFDYLFLTSIPESWEDAYRKILDFVKANNIPLAFSPGTRQIENKNELVPEILKHTKIYFSNREEAVKILNHARPASRSEAGESGIMNHGEDQTIQIKQLLSETKEMGPEIVSITDGPNGAYAIDASYTCYFIGPAPTQGHEKTGAGDGYATGFFAAILSEQDVSTAMKWGVLNSGSVMENVGAQMGLLTKKQLDERLKEHDNLTVEKI